ncbi:MAG: hypothetical protein ACLQO7_07270 [Candidatus Bathyarchaeia archaeon]
MQNHRQRFFSIELESKKNLKNVTMSNCSSDAVLLEGTLGELVAAAFKKDGILEVIGKNGALRINLGMDKISSSNGQMAEGDD